MFSQSFFPADPKFLIQYEKKQFNSDLEIGSNFFRPYFFSKDDSTRISVDYRNEFYFNNNAPNQENMDLRYFSKGYSNFNSLQISLESKFFDFIIEPYTKIDKFYRTEDISRGKYFSKS